MPELAAFQRDFTARLDQPMPQTATMRVYRNTVLLGAVEALAANFSVTRRIVGERSFETLALAFARSCPPEVPILALYGARFPDWLAGQVAAHDLSYLADVARCEQLRNEAMLSADAAALTPDVIAALEPERLLALRLRAHPATRFGWFATPAMAIWLAHQDELPAEIAPEWRPGGAVFTRPGIGVCGLELDAPGHRLLAGLRMGETLGAASRATIQLYPDAVIGDCFGRLIDCGAFAALPH